MLFNNRIIKPIIPVFSIKRNPNKEIEVEKNIVDQLNDSFELVFKDTLNKQIGNK